MPDESTDHGKKPWQGEQIEFADLDGTPPLGGRVPASLRRHLFNLNPEVNAHGFRPKPGYLHLEHVQPIAEPLEGLPDLAAWIAARTLVNLFGETYSHGGFRKQLQRNNPSRVVIARQ